MNSNYPESAVMTTTNTSSKSRIRFPDIPERTPDDMTSAKAIHINGRSHSLRFYFADRPNTIVDSEHYISRVPTRDMTGVVYPDLLVSFGADPQALDESNAYVLSEQGKPPDFILEIASRRTRTNDRTTKRDIYASLEVPEYWRFDQNPTRSSPPLAGERLVDGRYEPIPRPGTRGRNPAGPQHRPGVAHTLGPRSPRMVGPENRGSHPHPRVGAWKPGLKPSRAARKNKWAA